MTAASVSMERVEFSPPQAVRDYLQCYQRADIALDPFPCSGGTTTCDATWMGVPTITLEGKTAMGRTGVSIMSHVGLSELVAKSREDYVQIAAQLASDLGKLAELRQTLRARMAASPLCDASGFIRDLESKWRWMWQRWCAEADARVR